MESTSCERFCGRIVTRKQLVEINEIIETFSKLSRTELANTVCELFSWKRSIRLPDCRKQYANNGAAKVQRTAKADIQATIWAKLKELSPIFLTRVDSQEQRQLWYEYVDLYHYLGYQLPFGAQLRYFIKSGARDDILGCFQFSSPAWKMAPRDRWIGWTDEQRKVNLQKVINNSRFLIFPWVEVKNLASSVLALAAKTVADDWQSCYGYRPVLMETLVDFKRFRGTCYKAANWIHIGKTTGRGRMDRENTQQGAAVKEIYVYPLTPRFRQELAGC
jgi:hypothetical protein